MTEYCDMTQTQGHFSSSGQVIGRDRMNYEFLIWQWVKKLLNDQVKGLCAVVAILCPPTLHLRYCIQGYICPHFIFASFALVISGQKRQVKIVFSLTCTCISLLANLKRSETVSKCRKAKITLYIVVLCNCIYMKVWNTTGSSIH